MFACKFQSFIFVFRPSFSGPSFFQSYNVHPCCDLVRIFQSVIVHNCEFVIFQSCNFSYQLSFIIKAQYDWRDLRRPQVIRHRYCYLLLMFFFEKKIACLFLDVLLYKSKNYQVVKNYYLPKSNTRSAVTLAYSINFIYADFLLHM